LDTIGFEYLRDDLRHAELLVYLLVGSVGKIGQPRHHHQSIAGQTLAGLSLRHTVKLAVNACTIGCKSEEGRLVQQALKVDIRSFADDFQLEAIRLADRL